MFKPHSRDGRRFKPNLRQFSVPGNAGPHPTSQDARLPWILKERVINPHAVHGRSSAISRRFSAKGFLADSPGNSLGCYQLRLSVDNGGCVRNQALEPRILLLQVLHALGLLNPKSTVFPAPAIKTLLRAPASWQAIWTDLPCPIATSIWRSRRHYLLHARSDQSPGQKTACFNPLGPKRPRQVRATSSGAVLPRHPPARYEL
jgi:hypothetical protein